MVHFHFHPYEDTTNVVKCIWSDLTAECIFTVTIYSGGLLKRVYQDILIFDRELVVGCELMEFGRVFHQAPSVWQQHIAAFHQTLDQLCIFEHLNIHTYLYLYICVYIFVFIYLYLYIPI